jgi:hypothetical protein
MLYSFPWTFLRTLFGERFLATDYEGGLTDIKNKTPGDEPGVCL